MTEQIELYTPDIEDLWFREKFMADAETMSYNHAWGGTIPFPREDWQDWYDYWITDGGDERYYRYLRNTADKEFVGEVAYHYDKKRGINVADVIVYSKYRGRGYGRMGLQLLCGAARERGVAVLYDDIAIDNSAIRLFLQEGFSEEYRTDEIIMLKKTLA